MFTGTLEKKTNQLLTKFLLLVRRLNVVTVYCCSDRNVVFFNILSYTYKQAHTHRESKFYREKKREKETEIKFKFYVCC